MKHTPLHDATEQEEALFRERELWFWREIGKTPRLHDEGRFKLEIENYEAYSTLEQELLKVFLQERALFKEETLDTVNNHFVRFQTYLATDRRGIYCAAGGSSKLREYPGISLSEDANAYRTLVKQYGADTIAAGVDALVERGTLRREQTPDEKLYFYLDPSVVTVRFSEDTMPQTIHDESWLRQHRVLTAAAHSAEIPDAARRKVEADLEAGKVNVVMATPTLEMGIDIGELQNVMMVGVPPMPSNYAQRAGRAGRSQGNHYAQVITFCLDNNEHDRYYFETPTAMINGVISPPHFDPVAPEVVRQHINAWLLADHASKHERLLAFERHVTHEVAQRLTDLLRIFHQVDADEVTRYVEHEFPKRLRQELQKLIRNDSTQTQLYNSGFFPDYGFRRDTVYVVNETDVAEVEQGEKSLRDAALSFREPELAYYKLAPYSTRFMAGDVYDITAGGKWSRSAYQRAGRHAVINILSRPGRSTMPPKTLIFGDMTHTSGSIQKSIW